jgi:hypothetical protein
LQNGMSVERQLLLTKRPDPWDVCLHAVVRAAIADNHAIFASGWWPTFAGWALVPSGLRFVLPSLAFVSIKLPHILGLLDATELLNSCTPELLNS